jgi:hypothetical protein
MSKPLRLGHNVLVASEFILYFANIVAPLVDSSLFIVIKWECYIYYAL